MQCTVKSPLYGPKKMYRMVDNFREGLILAFYTSQEPFEKIKNHKISVPPCTGGQIAF